MTERPQHPSPDPGLAERLARVQGEIADAAATAGRSVDELTLIVVSKFQPLSLIRDLMALGVRDFGENRHQEAQVKAAELSSDPPRWHFVGQLQSKKARAVREYAHSIHSLDRQSLVDALSVGATTEIDCFVQLNLTEDPSRGGVDEAGLEALVEQVLASDALRLRGIMAVAPLDEEPRRAFARLRSASERVRALEPHADRISAGMSHDFADAILEGATHLRIGSAITGNRPSRG
ncbi:YggS family pyridoxal phosphate-dependent enzyme [Salinibacterium sp. SYSU T00001]|uniref:YggS family pyridoxal phosphate-dependent enzyme n=1 Tax=Homoserinimonas sedimenticola TaxID=2986805 RepID=UPI0022365F39|nr:YggS family pyridoxal phosphate-dependent enzyme [Salinibacterium sedimenticola]MCW4384283.1 YggS family pyridoxal phosphate-dependent enzyme [Salinibacterium sedimenticola]